MTTTQAPVSEFFDRYASALLERDAAAISHLYAVPSLILFPGQAVPVTDAQQTEVFFASSWSQYEGVDRIERDLTVVLEAPGSIWADVTWSYAGEARERFCYQLVEAAGGYQIAVLTPLALNDHSID